MDGPGKTNDYGAAPLLRPSPVEPTCSAVGLSHSCLEPPDPEEANAQNIPADVSADSAERGGTEMVNNYTV